MYQHHWETTHWRTSTSVTSNIQIRNNIPRPINKKPFFLQPKLQINCRLQWYTLLSHSLAAQQERILPRLQARTGELYEAGSFISQGQGTRGKKRWKKARHVQDLDVKRMNILLVGSCTKKQVAESQRDKERERQRKNDEARRTIERTIRRNSAGRKRNNCSGTVNREGETKKYPRINLPRREKSYHSGYTVSRVHFCARGFSRG